MKNYLFLILIIIATSCSKEYRFELLNSDDTGIQFTNTIVANDSLNVMNFEYIYNGAGVGIADLNNDNLQDIVFIGNQVSPKIYINNGNFKFTDISSNFKGLDNGNWYSGITFVDISMCLLS